MESYLVEGEKILARAGSLYASNKRLLRYKKHFMGEELDDIPYTHITSIGVVRKTRWGLIKPGIIMAVIGVFTLVTMMAISPTLKSVSQVWNNVSGQLSVSGAPFLGLDFSALFAPLTPLGIFVCTAGFLLIFLGVFIPRVFIQFRAPALNAETEAKFRLCDIKDETSRNLVRIVRQQSMTRDAD